MTLRVAIDATPLLGSHTGVATFTGGLLRALGRRDDIDVVAFAMSLRGWRRLGDVVPPGVDVVRRPLPAGVLGRVWRSRTRPTAELLFGREIDVVHGTNYVTPPTASAGSVVTVYDLTSVRFPEMVVPATLRYPDLVRRAVERGALVHVTSRAIGDEVVAMLGVPEERVRVVPSGVDLDAGRGDADRGRRLAGTARYVAALGTVEPRKGLAHLVAAFDAVADRHPDLRLVLAGPDGWGAGELTDAIDASAHRRRIRRLGWIGDRDRADLLAGASMLAMPSIYEGFGYPPLEAMAAGVPVVATTAGSLPEVLADAAILVPPGDDVALATAMARLLVDDAERARLIDAGSRRVQAFPWDECAAAMARVYRDASDRRP